MSPDQIRSFDQVPEPRRLEWSRLLRVNCGACYLFLRPEDCDLTLCMACRRCRSGGGGRCDNRECFLTARLTSLVRSMENSLNRVLIANGEHQQHSHTEAASHGHMEQEQIVEQVRELDKKLNGLVLRLSQEERIRPQQQDSKPRRQPGRQAKHRSYRSILPYQPQSTLEITPSTHAGQAVEIQERSPQFMKCNGQVKQGETRDEAA